MQQPGLKQKLETSKRIVIKIGSALLIDPKGDEVRRDWLVSLAQEISALQQTGKQIILVSSGAIALGLKGLGLSSRTARLEDAQAAAAIGQVRLAQSYQTIFANNSLTIAQMLLTLDDLEHRTRYLNARNTVETLLENNIIPVINENDSVATSEIRFGDNDRLAARVAQMCGADLLILLSDIDGLYTADPAQNANAEFIPVVDKISKKFEMMAGPTATTVGTGGMTTKLMAAKIAFKGGCSMVIMNGNAAAPLTRLTGGERATYFPASTDPLTLRKQWIQGMMAPKGTINIDAGAAEALTKGASLLPAGVISVEGTFKRGDLVQSKGPNNTIIGQGIVSYSSDDIQQIKGLKTSDVAAVLGYVGRACLIHRDDLVILH